MLLWAVMLLSQYHSPLISSILNRVSTSGDMFMDIQPPDTYHSAMLYNMPKCGDFDIHIAGDGKWYYQKSLIQRPEICKLFASVLCRKETGDYWLETPVEQGRISVADLPFLITEISFQEGICHFKTNLDAWIQLGPQHPLLVTSHPETQAPQPKIYLDKGLWARLSRSVFYQLADYAQQATPQECLVHNLTTQYRHPPYGLRQEDQFFPLEAPDM